MTHIFSSHNEYSPTYLFNRRILDDVFNSFYFHDPRSLGKFNKWTIEEQQPGLREIICSWSSYYSIYLVGGAITILKNISQWEGLSHILWKITTVWNHQPDIYIYIYILSSQIRCENQTSLKPLSTYDKQCSDPKDKLQEMLLFFYHQIKGVPAMCPCIQIEDIPTKKYKKW